MASGIGGVWGIKYKSLGKEKNPPQMCEETASEREIRRL